MRPILAALVPLLAVSFASPADAAAARFHVVRREGPRFRIEALEVADGQNRVLTCGRGGDYVDVIFPPSVGGSASLAQAAAPREIRLACTKGRPHVTVLFGGRTYEMEPIDDPAGADCRVSLVGADGTLQAFLLRGFATAEEDTVGPVADMFADHKVVTIFLGMVPALVPAIFMGLGLLVSFLQAFVFALLTMIYIGQALQEPH